jgi:multidrug efflux system membrane fusion protein
VAVRAVTIARTRGDIAVVAKGLQPGENVVTDGQLRLLPGSKISGEAADVRFHRTEVSPDLGGR